MNRLAMKKSWNETITKLKHGFADFAEDDMIFSEEKEIEIIRQLQKRLERSRMRLYKH